MTFETFFDFLRVELNNIAHGRGMIGSKMSNTLELPNGQLANVVLTLRGRSIGIKIPSVTGSPYAGQAATPQVTPTERKYEALYAEARESLCSCNHADPSAEPGSSMNYTCEWCEKHPEGADSPPIIKRLFAAEEELERLKAVPSATRKESGREETTVASSADRLTAAIDDYAAKVRGRILMNTESNASAETEARVALLKLWEGTSEQASPTPEK